MIRSFQPFGAFQKGDCVRTKTPSSSAVRIQPWFGTAPEYHSSTSSVTLSVVSPAPTPQLTPSEMMRMRYGGMGGRYGTRPPLGPPPPPVAPAPGVFTPRPRRGPETILDERPLKITMYIEAVRLIERARSKAGK